MQLEPATIQEVVIEELILNPEYQLRERLEAWKVEEYAAVFDRLPPVLVARLDGNPYLLDGLHRLAAAKQLGRKTLQARFVDTDPDNAFALAVHSNAAHGLPLRTKEKKAAARGMLVRFPERSDRWIAEDVGLSHPTVMGLRAELEAGGKICHLGYSLGQDGKRYTCACPRCQNASVPGLGKPALPDVWPAIDRAAGVVEAVEPTPAFANQAGGHSERASEPTLTSPSAADFRRAPILTFPPLHDWTAARDAIGRGQFQSGEDGLLHQEGDREATQIHDALGLAEPPSSEHDTLPSMRLALPLRAGPVTIWQGDARSLTEWHVPSVHLVVTSPPYNVGISYGEHCDALLEAEYFELLRAAWRVCYSVMAPGGRIAVVVPFGVGRNPWVPLAARVAELLTEAGFCLRGQIVWDKGTSGGRTTWGSFRLPTDPSLRDTTEAILIAHKGESHLPLPPGLAQHDSEGAYSPLLADQGLFMELAQDHWTVAPESATRIGHPAPFPIALAERLIRFYAYPGAHILDPFAGSGTTGVAALRLGCQATLVDIDGKYCCLAEERCRRALLSGEAYAPAA